MQIIMASWNNGNPTPVFNNAAQVWNHTFFWEGMSPDAGGKPSRALGEAIDKSFGSYDSFKEQFAAAGATQFGSGWAWLIANSDGSLEISKTANAVNPMVEGMPSAHTAGAQ
jgi:superoxide dismutase, Fe-Mn family